eukprot:jgi/Psemu1/292969/fgenesh1_pg.1489_\
MAIERRENRSSDCVAGLPKIPRVLYFSGGSSDGSVQEQPCWALFEYVGPDEDDRLVCNSRLTPGTGNHVDETVQTDSRNSEKRPFTAVFRAIDRSYLNGMIKTRTEYGFDEPHPRWGRVPVDQALDYAKIILNEVLLPLHRSSRRLFRDEQQSHQDLSISSKTYSGMVGTYRKALKDMTTSNHYHGEDDSGGNSQREISVSSISEGDGDCRLTECFQRLELALDLLENQGTATIPPLDPVLVHMDLQPQNLIFCNLVGNKHHRDDSSLHCGESRCKHRPSFLFPAVFSILDWEDAAWADPRFDLILLCRKVCANRKQADIIWSDYEQALHASYDYVQHSGTSVASSVQEEGTNGKQRKQSRHLGSIEFWLRLETVHSITTMLLQSMDLVNGGRDPWETKKDLWGKLQREFKRWNEYHE